MFGPPKIREGGYLALPSSVQAAIEAGLQTDVNGAPIGISRTLTKLNFLYLLLMFVGFALFVYVPFQIVDRVHETALSDEHVATFSDGHYYVGAVFGVFTAIIWAIFATYWVCARLPNPERRLRRLISGSRV